MKLINLIVGFDKREAVAYMKQCFLTGALPPQKPRLFFS